MTDLTKEEQTNVRTALKFLHTRTGGWEPLAQTLGYKSMTLAIISGGRIVTASLAFRVAKLAGVSVDDLLDGMYPAPGTCPHCGHCADVPDGTETQQ